MQCSGQSTLTCAPPDRRLRPAGVPSTVRPQVRWRLWWIFRERGLINMDTRPVQ